MPRSVTILGSTGVIGRNTLDVLDHLGPDYEVVALAAGENASVLSEQIAKYQPRYVSVKDEATRQQLVSFLSGLDLKTEIGIGDEGLKTAGEVASDIVVSAVVGAKGLLPTWAAVKRGAIIALANKETLVTAGDLVMPFAEKHNSVILPVDSEHAALHQSLLAGRPNEVQRYILTASGGPFRTWTMEQLQTATVEQALRHPNWVMGKKITIDSATLMNKGLEVIEAHHLFQASYDKIEVVVHPQSVIHSMVEYVDGSVMAQLATADMRLPIQYALTFDERRKGPWSRLDFSAMSALTFEAPDLIRFPSLHLAFEAGRAGGFAPCVLNAANEVAVDAFLRGRMTFSGMAKLVETVLMQHPPGQPGSLEDLFEMDAWARKAAEINIGRGGWHV